ncbi:MAG: hypothetical protein Q7R22_004895 [Verrucomicrobiota bacterium JB025]|nr:hypothetical protein [Verrucomicrobiota bacterium JB025]
MKTPHILYSTASLALMLSLPVGASTIFNGYAYVSPASAGVDATWYDLSGTAQSQDFEGADLGDFATTLWLGGQTGFWSEGNGVEFIQLNYSISGAAAASGTISYAFQSYSDPNDQWGTDVNGLNITDNSKDLIATHSLPEGDYSIAVWVEGKAFNQSSIYDSNGGSNFNATFTVVPEPGAAALGLLGTLMLLRRRRF